MSELGRATVTSGSAPSSDTRFVEAHGPRSVTAEMMPFVGYYPYLPSDGRSTPADP